MYKSIKQTNLETRILKMLQGKPLQAVQMIFDDPELQTMQEYANIVAIKRLGYNDHGPVHMRKATLNAIQMFKLLNEAGIKMNLEKEGVGKAEDSLTAVLLSSLLHDLGMSIARDSHEILSIQLAIPFIDRILNAIYSPEELMTKTAIKAITIEGIFGHMATKHIHSLEA
ncbi:MAG TPA: phosphohydrolase, partial [Candidatus Syntrophosphaera sp.]|nr:phosphohydrolase [Candidatus Syntrophosphaera sp.]